MFPKSQNRHEMEKRSGEKYIVNKAFTERYRRSAIPNMQRSLNNSEKEKIKIFKRIENSVPVKKKMILITLILKSTIFITKINNI